MALSLLASGIPSTPVWQSACVCLLERNWSRLTHSNERAMREITRG